MALVIILVIKKIIPHTGDFFTPPFNTSPLRMVAHIPQWEHLNAHRLRAPRKCNFRGWNLGGGVSRKARRGVARVTSHEQPATPLSLRRSTINVENVGGRLWQSRYNMSAGIRPQCFFIYWIATVVSLPRDDKGGLSG